MVISDSAKFAQTRIRLSLPEAWTTVELDENRDHHQVVRSVEQLLEDQPQLASTESNMSSEDWRRRVDESYVRMRESGVVIAAAWAQPAIGRTGLELLSMMLTASLSELSWLPGASSEDVLVSLSDLAAMYPDLSTDRPAAQVIELSAGPAVRVCTTGTGTPLFGTGTTQYQTIQYLLPLIANSTLATLSFSTPSIEYVDQLEAICEAIANTMEAVTQ